MAAVVDVQLVNISINDIDLQVPKGEMIVESVKRLGLEIPIFCYHPRMKPVGMCRMCLVEMGFKQPDGSVRKMPKPQAGCTLPASEGLAIYTDSQQIHTDRRGVLEFLLVNHPLDCPICDRGGECPLQNNTIFYGPSTSRFVELKRHAPKAFPLSQYVTLDLERCIQCGRCVRFTEEISGDAQLGFRFRGANMQPSTFEMRDFSSKFSGNVIEICPVGALTSTKYRFRARPWDLQTRPGVCTMCSNNCNIHVDYRQGQVVRINGRINEAVNEEWTCDKGKFGHDVFNTEKRLDSVMVRKGNDLVRGDWADAYAQILPSFRDAGVTSATIASQSLSNEDFYTLRTLFVNQFGSQNLDHRLEAYLPAADRSLKARLGIEEVQSSIVSFESAKSALVFGTSLADEEPILFLRMRKAWFQHGCKIIVAHDQETDLDSFAHMILRYKPGTSGALAKGLFALALGADAPASLQSHTIEKVSQDTGISQASLKEAASLLAGNPIVTTKGIYDLADGAETAEVLAGIATATQGQFNCYARGANEEGANLLGITPGTGGKNTHEILNACVSGEVKALWLAGLDIFEAHPDKELVEKALESVDFLVVQHWKETEAMNFASVVLPMTTPTEAEGTYTNMERRVQKMGAVLPVRGTSKPAWKAFSEVSMRISPSAPTFNSGEVLKQIQSRIPAYAGLQIELLAGEGSLLSS